MPDSLLIRADASSLIGAGHVTRCLALAQQWRLSGGRVIFAQAETTSAATGRLQDEGMETVALAVARGSADDAAQTIDWAQTSGAGWVVADGYCFGTDWQKRIHDAGLQLLIVDDYGHAEHYHADIVLNQNLSADASLYACRAPCSQLLLGSRYALLRREFSDHPCAVREIPRVARKVLVTLGGGDPANVTAKVLDALRDIPKIEAVVVVGGLNPHVVALTAAVKSWPAGEASIRIVVNAGNMPELMDWADVAVAAAGSTSWELAFMGLPTAVIILADNQAEVAATLERQGISINLGRHENLPSPQIAAALQALLLDQPRRLAMSQKGAELIDGKGASRVGAKLRAEVKHGTESAADLVLR